MGPEGRSSWLSLSLLLLASTYSSVLAATGANDTDPNCFYPEPTSHAFWVLGCSKPVLVERADPIRYSGVPSYHVNTIMGGNAFDFDLDYDKTQSSTCTTCGVTKDLSNYWVPTLYYHAENGSFVSVEQVGGINVYYQERQDWTEYCAGKIVEPFPRGFRVIAGQHTRRSFNRNSLEHQAIEFICLPGNAELGLPSFHGFPNRTCDGGLQVRLRFPSCWDGRNLDSPDHQSHMAYPSRLDNGVCPDSHPIRLPSLLYESTWSISQFNKLRKPGDQPFVLSHGDPTGFGYHGDFLNGWDQELLRTALRDPSCGTSSGGHIHKCKTFQPFLQSHDEQTKCPTLPGRLQEQVTGVIPSLPGCNRLQAGPEDAVVENCKNSLELAKPPVFEQIPSIIPESGDKGDSDGTDKGPSNLDEGDSSDSVEVEEVEVTAEVEDTTVVHDETKQSSASSYRSTWLGSAFRLWGPQMNAIRFAVMP